MTQTAKLFLTEREKLYNYFSDKLEVAPFLNRKMVSFQANKDEPFYRWFKYKEGFSKNLVSYFLSEYTKKSGRILDPFAGIGTTLFAAQELGWESHGVELLPIGIYTSEARLAIQNISITNFNFIIKDLWKKIESINHCKSFILHIPITKDAFPDETETMLNKYLQFCSKVKDLNVKLLLEFCAFSILEEISFTRKDGQYLRWDYRSKRELNGKPFDKGKIVSFKEAINTKINQIKNDIIFNKNSNTPSLFDESKKILKKKEINLVEGSCLEILPNYKNEFFDFIITSPPYCNRYDYTRTYALELIFLGKNKEDVSNLRQEMLSCTVENKEKINYLSDLYHSKNNGDVFEKVLKTFENSNAMIEINLTLDRLNQMGELNNNNIPRMVKNYFLELCFVIFEMSRIIKKNGYCVMVNDNVRYGGEEVPVDLVLSDFAEKFGFKVIKIFVLPKGKGNSSQQMGSFGRTEIRKCVYLWQKK